MKQIEELRGPKPLPSAPAREAPRDEWDNFDAANDRYLAEPLARAKKIYPAHLVDTRIAGVHVGIITPKDGVPERNKKRVLINLRGGGFVFDRGLSLGQLESLPVAVIGGYKVITVDYRQAPYHQYPAATEDVSAVYQTLLKDYEPEAIGIFGCSAGGILAMQAIAWFQAKQLPRPGGVGVFCMAPATVNGESGDSSKIWDIGILPKGEPAAEIKRLLQGPLSWYMSAATPEDALAYPGRSDNVLSRFPPTLLLVGTREFALSLAAVAHARFLKLGVDSSLYVMEGGRHGAHVVAVGTPEAHDANAYVAKWFDRHLANH